jgi:hypothetical protein
MRSKSDDMPNSWKLCSSAMPQSQHWPPFARRNYALIATTALPISHGARKVPVLFYGMQ